MKLNGQIHAEVALSPETFDEKAGTDPQAVM
jgi:hypothetical protein